MTAPLSTRGNGCLMVLDSSGKLVKTICRYRTSTIRGATWPLIDTGGTATSLFISMAGFDVTPTSSVIDPEDGKAADRQQGDRCCGSSLRRPPGQPPAKSKAKPSIGSGFAQRADKDVFS